MKFGFIGAGNMAGAIINGMVSNGFEGKSIYAYDINSESLEKLKKRCNINMCRDINEVCTSSDTIILAVKPNMLENILLDIKSLIDSNKLIISIAAGKTLDFISNMLNKNIPIVRVMPNINAKVGAATSGFCVNGNIKDEHKKTVESLFSTIGSIIEIDEIYFSIFGVIAGSSPAFAYLYIDSLARAAVKAGMDKKTALDISAQTVMGSAKMVLESGEHPWQLIDQVCSPGGTTIEGIAVLQETGFESAIIKAFDSVIEKDYKIKTK